MSRFDYNDVEAFAPFLDDFNRVYDEVSRGRSFAYNDDFKGRIPGIEGEHEGRAIYMLQNLRRKRENDAQVAAMLADGYEQVEHLDASTKFAHVAVMPHEGFVGTGPIVRFQSARVVPDENGRPSGVLPKGKRRYGHATYGGVVYAKR